jgi:hypothetical protein
LSGTVLGKWVTSSLEGLINRAASAKHIELLPSAPTFFNAAHFFISASITKLAASYCGYE